MDWDTFHDTFADVFGFPSFYGRNMNAWIDCMSYLDEMTSVQASAGEVVVLHLDYVDDFAARCPEQYAAIVEGAAFVNCRRVEAGEPAVLALSFHKSIYRGRIAKGSGSQQCQRH